MKTEKNIYICKVVFEKIQFRTIEIITFFFLSPNLTKQQTYKKYVSKKCNNKRIEQQDKY